MYGRSADQRHQAEVPSAKATLRHQARRQQRDHRSSRCPRPGAGHAVRPGRGASWPGCSWRTCEAWMPSSATPGKAGRGRQSLGHQPHRGLRLRPGQHRHRDRRRHRRDPAPQPRPLRLLQRHRPGRGVLGEPEDRRGQAPRRKRSAASNGGSATPSSPASRPTPGRPPPRQPRRAPEGSRGTTLTPARPARTPLVMAGLGAHRDRGGEPRPRALCEKLPTYASPLLLYAREIEPHSGWHLGNIPRSSRTWRSSNACVHLIREDERIAAG